MAKRQYIPRPRHLFPETAAFLIGVRRAALYLGFGTRTAIGRIPVWTAAALAGITSVMLSVMLFFVRDDIQAAPVTAPVAIPVVQQFPVHNPVVTIPLLTNNQSAAQANTLIQWDLPFNFSPNQITTVSSLDTPVQTPLAAALDEWRSFVHRTSLADAFKSYAASASKLSPNWGPLTASDTVPRLMAPEASRGMGLLIEKSPLEVGAPGEPVRYEIRLSNLSLKPIEQITVRETISALQRVTQVLPSASIDENQLVWTLAGVEPGGLTKLNVTLIPEMEGDIRTETLVLPETKVSAAVNVKPADPVRPAQPVEPRPAPIARPNAGKPELRLTSTTIPNLKERDNLSMTFSVTNVGTAPAERVILYVRLSGEFQHLYGDYVEHRIAQLAPGQTRRALLLATAREPGDARLSVSLTMQGWEVEARELRVPIVPDVTGRNSQASVANRNFTLVP